MIPGSGRSPGEGNGNPLQYSCLENPMDRGSWQAPVYGAAKSRIQLSDFTLLSLSVSQKAWKNRIITYRNKTIKLPITSMHIMCQCIISAEKASLTKLEAVKAKSVRKIIPSDNLLFAFY